MHGTLARPGGQDRGHGVHRGNPVGILASRAAGIGAARVELDPDGTVRRAALTFAGRPTLTAVAARREPGFAMPPDLTRSRLLHFNGPPRLGIDTVSYYQALDPERTLPADVFRDEIVLVGFSLAAPSSLDETADHFRTPVAARMSGVEIQATLLDTLLRGTEIAAPFGGRPALLGLTLVVGALASILAYRLAPAAGAAVLCGIGLAWIAGSYGLLAWARLHLPVVPPILVMAAAYGAGTAYRYALVSRERRFIKRAFEHYVAPAIVRRMLADPTKLALGGEEYEVTVLFTDLQGFTTLSEGMAPAALRRLLSTYFTEMLALLLRERATLDKLIGDSIMVYFGCPIRDPAHAEQACRGAIEMQRRMIELNRDWQARGLPDLRTRIGINTGTVVAGNIGTPDIFNYTILGDCVNLASRLEGVNKEYGTLTLVSDATWSRVRDRFEAREIDRIRVKGKQHPVAIYELAAPKGALPAERAALFGRFALGLERYRSRRWRPAAKAFESALALDRTDGPSATLLRRCRLYESNPPAADWGGVHVVLTK